MEKSNYADKSIYSKLELTCEKWSIQIYQNRDNANNGYIVFRVFPEFVDTFEGTMFRVRLAEVHIFQGTIFAGKGGGKFCFPAVILSTHKSLCIGVCWVLENVRSHPKV